MSEAPDRDIKSAVVSRLTWRLVPFLFLLYIVAYLDRINVGFAALQMQEQLGFSDAVYGTGAGIFFAGYFLFQVPSNLVLSRVGARRWLSVIMIVWGVISSSMIFVSTPKSFYAMRFLLGLAEAGFFPGVILYLKNWFPADALARTVALFMTAAPLSGVVGGPISGALLGLHHLGDLAGWQWMFLLEGVPAILFGGVVFIYLTDSPQDAHWLIAEHRVWLVDTLQHESEPSVGENNLGENIAVINKPNPFTAFTSGRIWMLAFVYFALNTCSYGISLWLPNLIRSLSGVSEFNIGLLSAIPYIAAAVAMVLAGLHSDRTGERRWHVAVSAFVGAAALLIASQTTSLVPMITAISVAVLGVFAMLGPFWAMPTSLLNATTAAAGIALINSIGNLGGFTGPYIIGLLRTSTGEFRGGLLVLSTALAVSGCVVLLVRIQRSPPVALHS